MAGIENLDMNESWLSDHPLVSTDIEINMNQTYEEKKQARLAVLESGTHKATAGKSFKIQVGVFNVLSLFASQIGENSNLVGEDEGEGEGKFFTDALYQELMKRLLDIDVVATPEKYKQKKDVDLQIIKGDKEARIKSGIERFEELYNFIIQELLPIGTDQRTACELTMNAYLEGLKSKETKIVGQITLLSEQDEQGRESFKLEPEGSIDIKQIQGMEFKEKLRYVLLMGGKVSKKGVLTLSLKIEDIHKCMIDNVLGTNTMGGFEYTKDSGLFIAQESYVQSKREFVRSVIQNFFAQRTPQGGEYDAKILVCPEFDLGDDFVGSILDDRIKGIKVGYLNTESIEASSLKNNDRNFGRYVFYQDTLKNPEYSELTMFYDNEKKKVKNTVSKIKFEFTQGGIQIPLVVYAVHLDSTTMDTYLDIQHEDFYKKRYETAQLLRYIMTEPLSKKPNTVTLIAGDFNCDFSSINNFPYKESGVPQNHKHKYFNSFRTDILSKEMNFLKINKITQDLISISDDVLEKINKYIQNINTSLPSMSPTDLTLVPLINENKPGTLKKRKFGFINAQADKGETQEGQGRSYPSDNVVLLNFKNQTKNFTVSHRNDKVTTDLKLTSLPNPKIYYPLFEKKIKVKAGQEIEVSVSDRRNQLLKAGQTPLVGGSRKRNRKRNKKSLKKRNKRKSSRKKSKNPRKKRSKRR